MKTLLFFFFLFFCFADQVFSQVKVRGYYRKNGTYVQPHYRSNPDGNPYNNWSYPGNVNPSTGEVATGNPETYLANYYKTCNRNTASVDYENYTSLLCYTSYAGMKAGMNYSLTNSSGAKIGRCEYYRDRIFNIYDLKGHHIGYVKYRNKKKYSVYDLYDYKVTSKKNTSGRYETLWIGLGIAALALVGSLYE